MNNKKIIVGALVIVAITLIIGLFLSSRTETASNQAVSTEEPTDIVLDFYGAWLNAVQSTSTSPHELGLPEMPILSPILRDRLAVAPEEGEIDPVLCQTTLPDRVSSRTILAEANTTQILVLSKEPKLPGQATFVLNRLNDGWYIEDIICSQGESATPREFTFDHEGGLYKDEQLPVDQQTWNLFYTQNATLSTVPLFFGADSMCTDTSGNTSTCNTEEFFITKVAIQGEMTERGVEVKHMTFID